MTTGSLAEILRSAILTVDKGQLEAAQAIGLTNRQAYIRIVFHKPCVQPFLICVT